jgi:hypothetical protein
MQKKKPKDRHFVVSFDMRWSHDVYVVAPNKWKARAKAFIRFIKGLKYKDFRIDVDVDDRYK